MKSLVTSFAISIALHVTILATVAIPLIQNREVDHAEIEIISVDLSLSENESEESGSPESVESVAQEEIPEPEEPIPEPETKSEKIPEPEIELPLPEEESPENEIEQPEPVEPEPPQVEPPKVEMPRPLVEDPKPAVEDPRQTTETPKPPQSASVDSVANDGGASAKVEAVVDEQAKLKTKFKPKYPDSSRRNRESGRVVLLATIDTRGKVSNVVVEQSCGFPVLDETAVASLRKASFAPAKRKGRAVETTVRLSFEFKLKND